MLVILASLILLFWISRIPHFQSRSLCLLPEHHEGSSSARVSLIVAARDEAAGIEASVRSLLSQDWPQLELIVVDDRSTDGTSQILDDLARQYPRLQVIHNRELPAGWLGKCWALHLGSQQATGQWLIFCDGDVIMQAHTLRSAVLTCEREGYGHLCLAPRMINQSFWQDAVVASLSFLFYLFQNPRHIFDQSKTYAYMGIGAFNMVRQDFYRAFGGHEALRLEVVDDVFLGMLMKKHGARSAFFLGHHMAHIHWYNGLWQYIRGLEKNSFAGLRFSWTLLCVAIVGQSLIFFLPPIAAFFSSGMMQILWLLSMGIAHALFIQCCRLQDVRWTRGLSLLASIAIQFVTFTRSAIWMTRQGGVVWRGNFYPIDELKAAQRKLRGPLIPRKKS